MEAVDIPQVMKTLFSDAEGIPQYINTMEAAQRKSKRAKQVITDKYMHAVALKSLLQSGKYETETREWSKLQKTQQIWKNGKLPSGRLMLQRDTLKPPGGRRKTLWWFRGLRRKKQKTKTKGAQLTHKMMESLGGYLNNIAAAAT